MENINIWNLTELPYMDELILYIDSTYLLFYYIQQRI